MVEGYILDFCLFNEDEQNEIHVQQLDNVLSFTKKIRRVKLLVFC